MDHGQNSVKFFYFDFVGLFRKTWTSAGQFPISMKLQILIEFTNTNKCSDLKSIIKCCFVGHSEHLNSNFNATHKKSKSSTKEDVFHTLTSGNSLDKFKYVIFRNSGCIFMGYSLLLKSTVFSVIYINSLMLPLI